MICLAGIMNWTLSDWISRRIKDWRLRRRRFNLWVMEDIGAGYLPTPKVASSAIRNLIRERQGKLFHGHLQLDSKSLKVRVEKQVKFSMKPERIIPLQEKLFLFSFVRNPMTRLYSCYRDKVVNARQKHVESNLSPYGIRFGMSFDEFVGCVAEIPDSASDQHFRSQHTFLTHEGKVLVHFLGRFERFESDWQRLTDEFGLECPPRKRRVSGPPVELETLHLTRPAAEMAMERYRTDLELFGYLGETMRWLDRLPAA
jgi:hypothetical protein